MTAHVVPDDLAPFRAHGGRVAAACAVFGGGDWIDLSTGIAPWPYPAAPARADRLPEPGELAALEAAARAAFGVPAGREVVAVPGSDLALRLLGAVLPSVMPAVVRPGYAGHAASWPSATPTAMPVGADALVEAAMAHDLIVFASPSNPDGLVAEPALVAALATRVTVVVDEAFADPAPGLASLDGGERLVVLRSFGKFHGLPGLRLGFVIAAPRVAARVRALLGDWPVSAGAIAAGTAAYRDDGWRAAQVARIAGAGARLDTLLAHAGLDVAGGTSLFRLIACADADALFRHLAGHAILTRPFADRPGRLRIGLPADAAACDRLATALEEFDR